MRPFATPSRAGQASSAVAGAVLLSLALPGATHAQAGSVGPAKCYSCHKELAKPVYEKVHKPALGQLDKPNAAAFAKAIGAGDPHGPRCLECHSPPVPGAAAGVSCEACHGPGKNYRDDHQDPAFYKQADRKGMLDTYNKPAVIAKLCVECHVTPDKALAAAGHPTGADFDPEQAIKKIVHWPSADQDLSRKRDAYGPAFYKQVGDAARPLVKVRAVSGAGAPAAKPPAPAAVAPPAAAPAAPAAPRPAPARAAAAPVAVPLSSDDPLFAEQVPLYEGPSGGGARAAAAAAPRPPAPRRPPPSIVEDRPAGFAEPALTPATPAPPAEASSAQPAVPTAARPAAPPSARDRSLVLLERLLRTRAHQLDLPPPSPAAEFRGTDSELLRLQDEILALALEALRRPSNP
jgi:Meckel syndrome type 1 protein